MTTHNTYLTAKNVKDELIQDSRKGSDMLIELVRTTSNNISLHKKSILLKSMLNSSETAEQREKVINEMISLANEIEDGQYPDEIRAGEDDSKRNYFLQKGVSKRTLIDCENVGKVYTSSKQIVDEFRLQDVNISLRLGEITGLVGENGNGKTTLLKILTGELKPSSGKISYYIDENKPSQTNWPNIKKNIAFLPQTLTPINGNIEDALHLTAAIHGIKGSQNKLETEYIIHRLGLMNHVYKKWDKLSGGYQLRFSLARLLLQKPKVLILDEPLANLDINTQNLLLNDLRDISKSISNPVSIILSSQHLEEVESVSDKMILLSAGKILYYGPTASIGELRHENTYEIKSSLSKDEIKNRLASFQFRSITHTGFSFLITTEKEMGMSIFAKMLLDSNVPITYLCDISNTTRKIILKLNQN